MSKKIVLIGAGSAQFGCSTLGDIFSSELLHGSEVALLDINPETLAVTEGVARKFIAEQNLPFTLSATTDRKEALKGADFIFISIEIGDRFALWDLDWQLAQQYGIQQVYGENGGPGGFFHSLRIIPPILDICQDVSDICPEAFVFNYSNPMSRICTTVNRKFPDLKFIGMCHEIASLERYLPEMLDTPFENLELQAAGLNHFSVVLQASYKDSGKDAYGDIRAKASEYFRKLPGYTDIYKYVKEHGAVIHTEGASERATVGGADSIKEWADRGVFMQVLNRFNYMPITSDSHFGEYIRWAHEVADHRGITDFYAFYRDELGKNFTPKIELKKHERAVHIIEGILSDSGYVEAAVNIPNKGYIAQLPEFICVEVPAVINAKGVHGVKVDMPAGIAGLLTNQIAIHDMTAEAIIHKSRDLAIQALLVDSVNDKCLNIPELVDTVISRQSPYLDYLK